MPVVALLLHWRGMAILSSTPPLFNLTAKAKAQIKAKAIAKLKLKFKLQIKGKAIAELRE